MPEKVVRIHYETKSGKPVTTGTFMSHITSALYGRMGEWEWTTVEAFLEPELSPEKESIKFEIQALRDENNSLRQECHPLRVKNRQHDKFMEEVSNLIPPSYDADEAIESIILGFLKDMQKLAQVIAKLTADYR